MISLTINQNDILNLSINEGHSIKNSTDILVGKAVILPSFSSIIEGDRFSPSIIVGVIPYFSGKSKDSSLPFRLNGNITAHLQIRVGGEYDNHIWFNSAGIEPIVFTHKNQIYLCIRKKLK